MLRQQLGLSQREVAELLDVTRVSVSRWETGERTPRGELLLRYLELLGRLARELE
jgi:transcriptional regulator with XRE-family HTH domain